MKLFSRRRLTLAAGAASLALLALPVLAGAHPGVGPHLTQRSGQFVILHADERDGGSTHQPMLVRGLQYTPVQAPDDLWIEPGARVRLEGTVQGGSLVLGDTVTAVTPLAAAPAASGTSQAPMTHTTAVVMFYFSNQTSSSLPPASTADGTMNTGSSSLRGYYLEQTYRAIDFQTDVFAAVQIPEPVPTTGDCLDSIYRWAREAEDPIRNPSLHEAQYQHIVYLFPALPQARCGWSGLAEVGGRHVWINGSFTVPVLAHELGHNLGLTHAAGLSCTSSGAPAPMGDTCSIDRQHYQLPQYADPFDAMGNAPVLRQMNMPHKLALGLLPPSAVQTVGSSGAYHVAPMETLTGSVELLKIAKPGGGNYFVEYRQPIGVYDAQGPSVTGVLIHTESPDISDPLNNGDSDTALVDMHPDGTFSPSQWQNAAMSPGQVFNDPVSGITIQNTAQDSGGATLQITMPVDTHPPSRPGRLSAVASGTSVGLAWTAASDDFGVDSYRVTRDGIQVGAPAATQFTDTGLTPGLTVAYAVTAVDTTGNVGPAATVSVTIPDTERPSVPPNVSAQLTREGQVHLTWGAATDNSGVAAYRILRGGSEIITTNGNAYVDIAPKPGNGPTVTYSVIALDLAGNASFPGEAKPLRAALLRKLGASHLKVSRLKAGKRTRLRVTGTISDAQARCRLRAGGAGPWYPCGARADGAFDVSLPARGTAPVTLSLRDALGRVRQQTLRVR
jgi:hypothetical protein